MLLGEFGGEVFQQFYSYLAENICNNRREAILTIEHINFFFNKKTDKMKLVSICIFFLFLIGKKKDFFFFIPLLLRNIRYIKCLGFIVRTVIFFYWEGTNLSEIEIRYLLFK